VLISSHCKLLRSKAVVVKVRKRRDMILAGTVERGERQPGVKIALQFVDRMVHPIAEHHPVERVECSLVKALADAVGLWALGLVRE